MEKGGLTAALVGAGVAGSDGVYCADELRLGLRGQLRRVLAPKGVKVVRPVQLQYAWCSLLLAVDPRAGALKWRWIARMNEAHITPVIAAWGLDCVVWDGAPAHKAASLAAAPTKRVLLPPYSPELNPAERLFAAVRRRVEGEVYASLEAKRGVAERYLRELAADPTRVRQLCGWGWLQAALEAVPARAAAA